MSDKSIEERVSELESRLSKVDGKTAERWEVGAVLGVLFIVLGFLVYQVYLA
jgi:tetrahydromethanopterin S-methyltransferase subunit G